MGDRRRDHGAPTLLRHCRVCGEEFRFGLWNPRLWFHGLAMPWVCPAWDGVVVPSGLDEALREALHEVYEAARRCDACGLTLDECADSGLPHCTEEVDAVGLLVERLRAAGFVIRKEDR